MDCFLKEIWGQNISPDFFLRLISEHYQVNTTRFLPVLPSFCEFLRHIIFPPLQKIRIQDMTFRLISTKEQLASENVYWTHKVMKGNLVVKWVLPSLSNTNNWVPKSLKYEAFLCKPRQSISLSFGTENTFGWKQDLHELWVISTSLLLLGCLRSSTDPATSKPSKAPMSVAGVPSNSPTNLP